MEHTEIRPVSAEESLSAQDFDVTPSESAFFSQLEKSLNKFKKPQNSLSKLLLLLFSACDCSNANPKYRNF